MYVIYTSCAKLIGGFFFSCVIFESDSHFAQFGDIVYTKIPPGKGCGFVQYSHRQSAEIAIAQMNNAIIGKLIVDQFFFVQPSIT
jgi:RNA recognition motif-containing protein